MLARRLGLASSAGVGGRDAPMREAVGRGVGIRPREQVDEQRPGILGIPAHPQGEQPDGSL